MIRRSGIVALLLALGATACANVDGSGEATLDAPSEATFQPVANYMIQRCGTLDCHGESGRNLRLYGRYGLRLDGDNASDTGAATTMNEYSADYLSVIGLEPEKMSSVVKGKTPASDLLLLAKPMGIQTHKGLTLIQKGDDQYQCLTLWLDGQDPATPCAAAAMLP